MGRFGWAWRYSGVWLQPGGGRDKEGMAAALKWWCFTYLFGFDHVSALHTPAVCYM